MSKPKLPMVALLVIQVVAFLIYPLSYFQRAPQAAVLPPALFLLFVLALVGVNTGTLSTEGGRNLLIFLQGLNTTVRIMTLLPNLKTADGSWAWTLLVMQIIGMALSWYAMGEMEKRPLSELRFKKTES
jgi:ABC-type Fe3+-siderophore transport system permease subunit